MDTFFLILAWFLGLLSIWLGFPQALLVGLIRGQLYRLEMSMNRILRVIWGGGIGCLSWYFTSFLWQWFFDYPVPLIFVIGVVTWSLLVNFVFGVWRKLIGLAKGNEIALLIGSIFFVGLSFVSEFYVFTPLGPEEVALNVQEEEPEITTNKVYGRNFLTSNEELQQLISLAEAFSAAQIQMMGLEVVNTDVKLEEADGLSSWFSAWQEITKRRQYKLDFHTFLVEFHPDFEAKNATFHEELCQWLHDPRIKDVSEIQEQILSAVIALETNNPVIDRCKGH